MSVLCRAGRDKRADPRVLATRDLSALVFEIRHPKFVEQRIDFGV